MSDPGELEGRVSRLAEEVLTRVLMCLEGKPRYLEPKRQARPKMSPNRAAVPFRSKPAYHDGDLEPGVGIAASLAGVDVVSP